MPSSSSSNSATESDSNPDIECSSQESDESPEELSDGRSSPIPRPFLQLFYFIIVWQVAFRVSTSAICALLKFLKFFCFAIGSAFNCLPLKTLSNAMPLTKVTLMKILAMGSHDFTEYIVCPKCDSIYSPDYCKRGGKFIAILCPYKAYPNHPHVQRRKECGASLMRTVQLKSGLVYKPIKIFPYQSIKKAIAKLAQRPGFVQCCELWRERSAFRRSGYMCDVYDGEIWSQYNDFLSAPYNYLLTLNVDWFSPFDHGCYSVGAIYLTIQNLPSSLRNNPDNIILVGIIPGPTEPHLTLNSYLSPMKEELLQAWSNGFEIPNIPIGNKQISLTIRLALTCIACDIPASRKVCGFLGHRATSGCNKCYTTFKQVHEDNGSIWTNYGGFDRMKWTMRTNENHRERCEQIIQAFRSHGTKAALTDAESCNGLRYSVLLDLPYFDPVRYCVVDPMHNLYLGTGKHMMEIWLKLPENNMMKNFDRIESLINDFIIPEGIGRLPSKISSHFGGFTADQWRNWITIYSPIVLWQVLQHQHWNCWILFVQAVKMISVRVIEESKVSEADALLQKFCQMVQELYGDRACTINMHLHLHLFQSLHDFGPANAFWLYSFERYNGLLGSFHTNNRRIESQIMQRFLESQSLGNKACDLMDDDFLNVLPNDAQVYDTSALNVTSQGVNVVQLLTLSTGPIANIDLALHQVYYSMVSTIGPFKEYIIITLELQSMEAVMQASFGQGVKIALKSKFAFKFGKLFIGNDLIGSEMPRSSVSSSLILAHWPGGPLCETPDWNVGKVHFFLEATFSLANTDSSGTADLKQIFAFVHWFKPHQLKGILPNSVCRICETIYYPSCKWNFIPVHRIARRCAHITLPFQFSEAVKETVLIACPTPLRLKL